MLAAIHELTRADETLPTLAPHKHEPFTTKAPEIRFAARTDVGKKRSRNEDQFLVAHLGRWVHVDLSSIEAPSRELTSPQGTLLVVADGMGGQGGGDVASAVALDSLVHHSLLDMPWLGVGTPDGDALLAKDVQAFVIACQERLTEVAARKSLPPRLGTTLTAAYLTGSRLVLMHVGDTRAYVLRAGTLHRLSQDHTLAAALGPKPDGTPSAGANILMNAIGGSSDSPKPELAAIPLQAGDRILLCSDGLYGPVDDARIAQILGGAAEPQAAVDALIEAALEAGGPDNVTAVVAFG